MTEKTLYYKSLKGLISKTQQFSLATFISGRFHHNKHGWSKFKVTDKVHDQIKEAFEGVIGSFWTPTHSYGIYERLIINKRNLEGHYIAGQNYPSELREIRKLLKGGC